MADEGKGAPADFGGPVFPNPKGIKPVADDEIERPSDKPMGGGKFSLGGSSEAHYDISNPPAADVNAHPVHIHFSKKGGPIRKLHSAPADVSEN